MIKNIRKNLKSDYTVSQIFSFFWKNMEQKVGSAFITMILFLRFLKTNLMADISKKEKRNMLLFLYYSLGYSNTVIHSIWCVWGNISTGCTWENLNPLVDRSSTSLAIVIGLQEMYKSLNWYSFFKFPR